MLSFLHFAPRPRRACLSLSSPLPFSRVSFLSCPPVCHRSGALPVVCLPCTHILTLRSFGRSWLCHSGDCSRCLLPLLGVHPQLSAGGPQQPVQLCVFLRCVEFAGLAVSLHSSCGGDLPSVSRKDQPVQKHLAAHGGSS